MNPRIYDLQAKEVHRRNSAEGKEMERKDRLFQPRAQTHAPVRLKKYETKEPKIETRCCIVM